MSTNHAVHQQIPNEAWIIFSSHAAIAQDEVAVQTSISEVPTSSMFTQTRASACIMEEGTASKVHHLADTAVARAWFD
jgi:hypothetical protein